MLVLVEAVQFECIRSMKLTERRMLDKKEYAEPHKILCLKEVSFVAKIPQIKAVIAVSLKSKLKQHPDHMGASVESLFFDLEGIDATSHIIRSGMKATPQSIGDGYVISGESVHIQGTNICEAYLRVWGQQGRRYPDFSLFDICTETIAR